MALLRDGVAVGGCDGVGWRDSGVVLGRWVSVQRVEGGGGRVQRNGWQWVETRIDRGSGLTALNQAGRAPFEAMMSAGLGGVNHSAGDR
jgi:hypothetical protein